jgi:hypothetical protein
MAKRTARKFKIFSIDQIDEENVAKLEADVTALVNSKTNDGVMWLQSSACEGTLDGIAMFTQLTAVVTWLEDEEITP